MPLTSKGNNVWLEGCVIQNKLSYFILTFLILNLLKVELSTLFTFASYPEMRELYFGLTTASWFWQSLGKLCFCTQSACFPPFFSVSSFLARYDSSPKGEACTKNIVCGKVYPRRHIYTHLQLTVGKPLLCNIFPPQVYTRTFVLGVEGSPVSSDLTGYILPFFLCILYAREVTLKNWLCYSTLTSCSWDSLTYNAQYRQAHCKGTHMSRYDTTLVKSCEGHHSSLGLVTIFHQNHIFFCFWRNIWLILLSQHS